MISGDFKRMSGRNCGGLTQFRQSRESWKVGKVELTQFSKVPSAFRLRFGTNSVGAGCPSLQRWQGHSVTCPKKVSTG